MPNISALKGLFDILPLDKKTPWKNSHIWSFLENFIREFALKYGFREIRTPLFEKTELFHRGVGEETDIVSKEMYTFQDKGNRSLTLRPEGTAPVIRSFIEHHLHQQQSIHKFFYLAPMFRYERPQAGRYRQHHQFGVEVIGNSSYWQDVELIEFIYQKYQALGLKNISILLNSVGNTFSRNSFKKDLITFLSSHYQQLSEDSQCRLKTNPLRILDSKSPHDQQILEEAPSLLDYLDVPSKEHFEGVCNALNSLKIPFKIEPQLVRGLDYYNHTVFEVITNDLGAQNSLCGGGRYDGLIKNLGGPDLPSIGFGCGLERLIQVLVEQQCPLFSYPVPDLYLIPMDSACNLLCYKIAIELRKQSFHCEMDFSEKKLKSKMKTADQLKARYTLILGQNELDSKKVAIKHMETGKEHNVEINKIDIFLQEHRSN